MTSSARDPVHPRPLIIGYGNPLRQDDGVGWHVARAVAADPRAAGVDVIAAHQLTPELAEDLHTARLAVVVDACEAGMVRPGCWVVDRVEPAPGRGPSAGSGPVAGGVSGSTPAGRALGGWSHHCTPRSLATLARQLYGSVAPLVVVGVGTCSMGSGDWLSAPVERAIPALVDVVFELVGAAHGAGAVHDANRETTSNGVPSQCGATGHGSSEYGSRYWACRRTVRHA